MLSIASTVTALSLGKKAAAARSGPPMARVAVASSMAARREACSVSAGSVHGALQGPALGTSRCTAAEAMTSAIGVLRPLAAAAVSSSCSNTVMLRALVAMLATGERRCAGAKLSFPHESTRWRCLVDGNFSLSRVDLFACDRGRYRCVPETEMSPTSRSVPS